MLFHSEKLGFCHVNLANIVKKYSGNVVVVCTYRSHEDQEKAYKSGNSKARAGQSKHNILPSRAVDLAPCDDKGNIDWKDIEAFKKMAEEIMKIASEQKIKLIWGGDFKRLGDYGHFELN